MKSCARFAASDDSQPRDTTPVPFGLSLYFPTVLSLSKEALLGNWRYWHFDKLRMLGHFDKLSANGVLCVSLVPRSRIPQYCRSSFSTTPASISPCVAISARTAAYNAVKSGAVASNNCW